MFPRDPGRIRDPCFAQPVTGDLTHEAQRLLRSTHPPLVGQRQGSPVGRNRRHERGRQAACGRAQQGTEDAVVISELGKAMTVRILKGDCREVLRDLPAESVHCVVTSPPYWGLRDYGVAGQIGLEETPEDFAAEMVSVFRQ